MLRYRKRYIIPAILLAVAAVLGIILDCGLTSLYRWEKTEWIWMYIRSELRLIWPYLLGVLCMLVYCFVLNHKKAGKIFFFVGGSFIIVFNFFMVICRQISRLIKSHEYLGSSYAESTICRILIAVFTIAAIAFLMANRAKPKPARMILTIVCLDLIYSVYAYQEADAILNMILHGRALKAYGDILIEYLYMFLTILPWILIVAFDFAGRPKKELTPEEQMIRLKEKFEKGEIDVYAYDAQREEILNNF